MPSASNPRFDRPLSTRRRAARAAAALAALAVLALPPAARAADGDWPRQFDSASGLFTVYQPQPEVLEGDRLSSRAAFSLQKSAEAEPLFGVLWYDARIAVDRDSSTATETDLDVTRVRLPGITADEAGQYERLVESEARSWDLSGSLEELQAGLAAAEKERASVADLDDSPPRILFMHERAILLAYDGTPVLEAIEGSKLERVANTPYAVIHDPASRLYYLAGADAWYSARDPLGPWQPVTRPPDAVRAVVPPDTVSADRLQGVPPVVLTATEPTELISTDGAPRYAPLAGDELLYVTNTESDVVREVSTQRLYVLLAGRWFRAPSENGPWTFVRGDQLPASFRRVPADSPKGNILASVAGTDQAEDALADAEIPQTTAIQRDANDFEVTYDGDPEFEPIDGTDLRYAVNTDAEVIFADGRYYACDQGVWYISDGPYGPWVVSETRPLGLDDIPPACPVYNVRYVYIYDWTPTVVYVGYLPGYLGSYPHYGTVVYGTGYRFKPWHRRHFYPRPWTWGCHARYNPWLSRWSFGTSYGSGFLRISYRWRWWQHPSRHHGSPQWFGPGGYHRPLVARDLTLLRTRRIRPRLPDRTPANLYNRSDNVVHVDRTAARVPVRPVVQTPAPRATRLPNDVFAGKDGKVYRRDPGGRWKVQENRTWKPTVLPTPVTPATPSEGGGGRTPRTVTPPAVSPPAVSPAERPAPRPAPVSRPAEPQVQPRRFPPAPAPAAPAPREPSIGPSPGDLEREFRARQRSNEGAPAPQRPAVERPTPARPAPAEPERDKGKAPPERKHKG